MESLAACLCGELETELEEGRALPPSLSECLMAAMQEPHETLNVPLHSPPWARRDALRQNCVRLLSRRELVVEARRSEVPGGARPPAPHGAACLAFALLEAVGRRRLEAARKRLPKLVADGHFSGGSPRDMLHTLRCVGRPWSRACGMLRCACVGARRAESAVVVELEIEYCARTAVVRPDLRKLAACCRPKLAALVEALARGDAENPARVGRLVARSVSRRHAELARRGLFSAALLEALEIDYDRVWREEEPRLAALLDRPEDRRPDDVAYLADADWLATWRAWVTRRPGPEPRPPGPLRPGTVLLSASLFAYFEAVHGAARPRRARSRTRPDPVLPARPVALALIQRAWRRALPASQRDDAPSRPRARPNAQTRADPTARTRADPTADSRPTRAAAADDAARSGGSAPPPRRDDDDDDVDDVDGARRARCQDGLHAACLPRSAADASREELELVPTRFLPSAERPTISPLHAATAAGLP